MVDGEDFNDDVLLQALWGIVLDELVHCGRVARLLYVHPHVSTLEGSLDTKYG